VADEVRGSSILVVDDAHESLRLLGAILRRGGFIPRPEDQVLHAYNQREGPNHERKEPQDIGRLEGSLSKVAQAL
jgi:CheY-like chemotaxis protein